MTIIIYYITILFYNNKYVFNKIILTDIVHNYGILLSLIKDIYIHTAAIISYKFSERDQP